MGRVIVITPGYSDHAPEAKVARQHGHRLEILAWNGDRSRLRDGLAGADLAFVRDTTLGKEEITAMAKGGGIVRYGIGVDGVDIDTATRRRIKVANIPDYGADADVADHTLALFLAQARRICTRDTALRAGEWGIGQAEPITRIAGRTLGLVGYGRIGRAVHRRFAAFGIQRVFVHDPFLPRATADEAGVHPVTLADLAAQSDIISLHAPATADAPIIDAGFLATVKRGAVLINTSRGGLVDEDALAKALVDGRLSGAGLDVFRQEPPAPSNPLLGMTNVVLSDHTGWYSEESVAALQKHAAAEADRILSGAAPRNWINPW